jgi:glutamate-1-semialdehyde 2,1-aminomutase
MGLRAVTLGYAFKPVVDAAVREIRNGNTLTRPSLTELQAAQVITDLIPCAEMVKFAKNGSTVTTAAVKLARAFTGRKFIAVCAQHPFFSYDDWFIGSTPLTRGIPEENQSLTLKFNYNDFPSLESLFSRYPSQIAGVILEPATTVAPTAGFLEKIASLCRSQGAVFILDEMITGFRWHLRGAQAYYGVTPDLATFGKGMANGFSVAALVGKREIMNLGGILDPDQERVFLISTTHGAEMSGLGAFLKTVEFYRENAVIEHMWAYGKKLMEGAQAIARDSGIMDFFFFEGFPCSPTYCTRDAGKNVSLEFRTLFAQEMLRNGILMPWVSLSWAHGNVELEKTLAAIRNALKVYSLALEDGVEKYLEGKPIKPVFRKRN